MLIFRDKFGMTTPTNPIVVGLKNDLRPTVKHAMLWLHPYRNPGVVLLTSAGKVIYSSLNALLKSQRTSPPNGYYGYSFEVAKDADTFITCFHHKAEFTNQMTILRRDDRCAPCWRAVGDENGVIADVSMLRDWHIVMLQLSIGSSVVLANALD